MKLLIEAKERFCCFFFANNSWKKFCFIQINDFEWIALDAIECERRIFFFFCKLLKIFKIKKGKSITSVKMIQLLRYEYILTKRKQNNTNIFYHTSFFNLTSSRHQFLNIFACCYRKMNDCLMFYHFNSFIRTINAMEMKMEKIDEIFIKNVNDLLEVKNDGNNDDSLVLSIELSFSSCLGAEEPIALKHILFDLVPLQFNPMKSFCGRQKRIYFRIYRYISFEHEFAGTNFCFRAFDKHLPCRFHVI